ncbi:hypothetical protein H6F73_10945 [Microcoleus sp. FACHB-68]|nr:hypothetical protein [Microcoleus sp. FACHB-68]
MLIKKIFPCAGNCKAGARNFNFTIPRPKRQLLSLLTGISAPASGSRPILSPMAQSYKETLPFLH